LWHGERIAGWRLLPSFDLEHSTEDRLRIVQRRVNPHVQGSLEQLRAQLVRPADQSQRRVQDRHPVAQPLGLLKPVRGQEDRHPALAKRGDLFTPLLAGWSIWVGIAISARSTDIRVAQQLSVFASIPPLAVVALMQFKVITPSTGLALALAAALLIVDVLGWRAVAAMFDRERLVTGVRT